MSLKEVSMMHDEQGRKVRAAIAAVEGLIPGSARKRSLGLTVVLVL